MISIIITVPTFLQIVCSDSLLRVLVYSIVVVSSSEIFKNLKGGKSAPWACQWTTCDKKKTPWVVSPRGRVGGRLLHHGTVVEVLVIDGVIYLFEVRHNAFCNFPNEEVAIAFFAHGGAVVPDHFFREVVHL